LEDADWLIGFERNDEVVLRIYSHDERDFLDFNAAPLDATCENVFGRPALARLGDTIVMAGIWGPDPENYSIWIQVGEYDPETPARISWYDCYLLDQPANRGDLFLKWNLLVAPSLTHDHSTFYLSTVEHYLTIGDVGDETAYRGWDLVLYRSANPSEPDSWSVHAAYAVSPYTRYVNIAGRSDGTILAIVLAAEQITDNNPRVFRWTDAGSVTMDADDVFGRDPTQLQFALISVGRPPTGE
jgi:hypothetical protein